MVDRQSVDQGTDEIERSVSGSKLSAALGLSYEDKLAKAKTAQSGDVWVNSKTGRKATITNNNWYGVSLLHESGRKTQKQHHYFAYDYHPTKP